MLIKLNFKLPFLNVSIFGLSLIKKYILCATDLGTRLGTQSWLICINIYALFLQLDLLFHYCH